MTWTFPLLLLALGLGTAAVANRFRFEARLVVGFGVGVGLFLVIPGVSRAVVLLASMMWGSQKELPTWVFVVLNGLLAQLIQTAGALILSTGRPGAGAVEGMGAAVGAGFGFLAESAVLRGAFQLAELRLPGGPEVGTAVLSSLGRLVAGSAVTGLSAGLMAEGRWGRGVAAAVGLRALLDLAPRFLEGPAWIAGVTVLCAAVLYGGLVVWIRSMASQKHR